MIKHGLWKLKRVMGLVRSYPEEALWEPVFRVWHLGWRMIIRQESAAVYEEEVYIGMEIINHFV